MKRTMWKVRYVSDPLKESLVSDNNQVGGSSLVHCTLAHALVTMQDLVGATSSHLAALDEDKTSTRIALADFTARRILSIQEAIQSLQEQEEKANLFVGTVQLLDQSSSTSGHHRRHRRSTKKSKFLSYPPFILQRTDIWCNDSELHLMVRIIVHGNNNPEMIEVENKDRQAMIDAAVEDTTSSFLSRLFPPAFVHEALQHVACAVLQQRARSQLETLNAVAFVANGAILPRKSGASSLPMASPPAVPFEAPANSKMSRCDFSVDMGSLRPYTSLPEQRSTGEHESDKQGDTTIKLSGLCIPTGVTLICGGGYHGKSTLLRTIAVGVYDKIPGDGREYCVTVYNAVSVRAEDGRYINNCNISAFISNLPTLPGVETSAAATTHFCSKEASGSTSQAANVSEAVEMGATALLVDEDVSAANFMARDGRMRALVMDESITPLLYRVNGLYQFHGVSSIVVVGGVGDWLDVQDAVVLMDKYIASDATEKARSISYQFSYGHVQYAGRGVVHRLPWDKSGTPNHRRPSDSFSRLFDDNTVISILDGGGSLSLTGENDMDDNHNGDDEHLGLIDMSRCEQLMGNRAQLYGCGVCVKWLLKRSQQAPTLSLCDLLTKMEEALNQPGGMIQLFEDDSTSPVANNFEDISGTPSWTQMVESIGCAIRPRKHEVAMALMRMRGSIFEELPIQDDGAEAEAAREEERRKRELMEMWNSRRKSKPAYG